MNKTAHQREAYHWFTPITTRWMDNDVYGHVNNVNYYSYFDTVANSYLMEAGGLDYSSSTQIGYVVHSSCDYFAPIAFPEAIEGGLRINTLGNSSVEYGIAIFKPGERQACAQGSFTHVFVNRETERPEAIAESMREALQKILA